MTRQELIEKANADLTKPNSAMVIADINRDTANAAIGKAIADLVKAFALPDDKS